MAEKYSLIDPIRRSSCSVCANFNDMSKWRNNASLPSKNAEERLKNSCIGEYIFLDRMSWENFNESVELKSQIEAFKSFTGYDPELVHVDRIYRTRENRESKPTPHILPSILKQYQKKYITSPVTKLD